MSRSSNRRTPTAAALNLRLRALHAYAGMLIAPTTLFLACTGLIQVYNLHEAHAGYTPPLLVERLSRVHKDQTFASGRHHAAPAARAKGHGPPPAEDAPRLSVVLLKAVFAAIAVGLAASTLVGVWMGLTQSRRRRLCVVLLIIGAAVPVGLTLLTA